MFRNYLAAALRNLVRNRLYAAINIVGLAVGFAAALLIALFVRDELSYDRWMPRHERTFLIQQVLHHMGSMGTVRADLATANIAPLLRLQVPMIEAATAFTGGQRASFRRGEVEGFERYWWADSSMFDVLPVPAVAGAIGTALDAADSVVLTRSMARKYFGRDDVVGETLEFRRDHAMRITAVIEDLPPNSHLDYSILLSASTAMSPFATPRPNYIGFLTYVRLRPGYGEDDLRAALQDFLGRQEDENIKGPPDDPAELNPVNIGDIHLSPDPLVSMKLRGSRAILLSVSAVGVLILLIAVANALNLMTAWGARRATEVGVRKVSGAERLHLVAQFTGEGLLHIGLSAMLGLALAALISPWLQSFLERASPFPYWRALFVAAVVTFVIVLGILGGLYPAFVLSGFRPAEVLKTAVAKESGAGRLRQIFTTMQFAVLIGLLLATATIAMQLHFAFTGALRVDTDQIIDITTGCRAPLRDRLRELPGVHAAICSGPALRRATFIGSSVIRSDGAKVQMSKSSVAPGFFELYGVKPIAGRLLSLERGDEVPFVADQAARPQPSVIVLNETAVRRLGFASPEAAMGHVVGIPDQKKTWNAQIVGVVPDLSLDTVGKPIDATYYFSDPAYYSELNVRLSGENIPETLAAIDQLWKTFGEPRPIDRVFVDQQMQSFVQTIARQAQVFGAFLAVSVLIACLGLFGLAAFTAERRTKEIGVRKAMGAARRDVLQLVLWDFAKPVLWANVIAWPVGYLAMRRWLEGFAQHIDLSPIMFLAASAVALLIAGVTVAGHALLLARARPVTALRYE